MYRVNIERVPPEPVKIMCAECGDPVTATSNPEAPAPDSGDDERGMPELAVFFVSDKKIAEVLRRLINGY